MFILDSPSLDLYLWLPVNRTYPGGWGRSRVLYGLLTSVLSWSETTPDPRFFSYETRLRGHVYCAKEFLCSHALSFMEHLEWQ